MSKVVSINNKRFLGAYDYARNSQRIPEADDVIFFSGVLFSMVLPEGFYIVYGGLAPLIAFAGSALAGSLWGVTKYRRGPRRFITCLGSGTVPQAPKREDANQKRAA